MNDTTKMDRIKKWLNPKVNIMKEKHIIEELNIIKPESVCIIKIIPKDNFGNV